MSSAQASSAFAADAPGYGSNAPDAYYALNVTGDGPQGVTQLTAGTGITLSPATGTGVVEITSTAGAVADVNGQTGNVTIEPDASNTITVESGNPEGTIKIGVIQLPPAITVIPATASIPSWTAVAGSANYSTNIVAETGGAPNLNFMGNNIPALSTNTYYRITGTARTTLANPSLIANAMQIQIGCNTNGVIPSTTTDDFTYQVINQTYPPNFVGGAGNVTSETIPFNLVVEGNGQPLVMWWRGQQTVGEALEGLPSTIFAQYLTTSPGSSNLRNSNWSIQNIGAVA